MGLPPPSQPSSYPPVEAGFFLKKIMADRPGGFILFSGNFISDAQYENKLERKTKSK
jgi:hypothetical protein